MASFQLEISIPEEQLQMLYYTQTKLVISMSQQGNVPNVGWQVFKPLKNNMVSWKEEYGLYASNTPIEDGLPIKQLYHFPPPAVIGDMYTLQPSGVFTGSTIGGTPNCYTLRNTCPEIPYVTMGLTLDAIVNGTEVKGNAVSAESSFMMMEKMVFCPNYTIFIWLQVLEASGNSMITSYSAPITELKFEEGVDKIFVKYDNNSGRLIRTNDKS